MDEEEVKVEKVVMAEKEVQVEKEEVITGEPEKIAEEENARAYFKFLEERYLKLAAEMPELEAQLNKGREQKARLEAKIQSLEERRDILKTPEAILRKTTEINVVEAELKEVMAKSDSLNKKLSISRESLEGLKKDFALNIPEGAKLLEDMTKAEHKDRLKTRMADMNSKRNVLEKEEKDVQILLANIKFDPKLGEIFKKFSSYPSNCMELLVKEMNKTISKEELVKLNTFKKEHAEHKKNITKYLKEKGFTSINFKEYEKNLFAKNALIPEDNFNQILDLNRRKKNDLSSELQVLIETYQKEHKTEAEQNKTSQEKPTEQATVRPTEKPTVEPVEKAKEETEKKVEEKPIEESVEKIEEKVEGKTLDKILEAEEKSIEEKDMSVRRPSIFSRLRNRFSKFFKRFSKEEEKEEKVEEEKEPKTEAKVEEVVEQEDKSRFSDEFMKEMSQSELFKENLKKAAEKSESEINQDILNKQKSAQEKRESQKDHER